MKHTKGNWQVKQSGEYKNIFVLGHITNPNGHTSICNTAVTSLSEEEKEANAKLIAAAPDLLNAIQVLLKEARQNSFAITHNLRDTEAEILAQQAINKATL